MNEYLFTVKSMHRLSVLTVWVGVPNLAVGTHLESHHKTYINIHKVMQALHTQAI